VKTYLLTGGTGFLGSYLSKKLLVDGSTIIFLGRSKDGVSLENRISKNLSGDASPRVKYLEMDILANPESLVKLVAQSVNKIDGIWHLAADLSFKIENRDRVLTTNINGTKSMLALARHFKCRLYYMSTAYVHGRRAGVALEKIEAKPAIFNNPYEESKYNAELVIHAAPDVDTIIFRPSILIDQHVERINNFGYYSFILSLIKLRTSINLPENKVLLLPVPILYRANSVLNLMPVDIATEWMIEISKSPKSSCKIFHICNPKPFLIESIFRQTFQALAIRIPIIGVPRWLALPYLSLFVACGSFIRPLRSVARKIKYFKWYMLESASYDQSNIKSTIKTDIEAYFDFDKRYIYTLVNSFKARFEIESMTKNNI